MRLIKVAGVLGLAVSFCMALTISGTVTDSLTGNTMAGATVSLAAAGLSATTNISGTFLLTRGSTDVISRGSEAIAPNVPAMSAQGEIKLNIQEPARVTVKSYSAQGKQIGFIEKTLGAGNHSIMPAKTNSGVYLYQVIVNGKSYTLQQTNVNGRAYTKANANGSSTPFKGIAKSAAGLAFSDQISVSKNFYGTQQRLISDSMASGLTFKMNINEQSCPAVGNCATWGTQSGQYYIYDNQWNSSKYTGQYTECLYFCDYNYFYLIINMNNDQNNGECKTYPAIQRNFNPAQSVNALTSLTADFAESSPHSSGSIYEATFDMWLWGNSAANTNKCEVMIWNDNWHQSPGGTQTTNVTIDGITYQRWFGSGTDQNYMVYLPTTAFYSKTGYNILNIYKDAISKGWIPASPYIGQICFGFEMVSTNHRNECFLVSNYELHIQ
jgi:hypothetical protein